MPARSTPPAFDEAFFRTTLGRFATGVTVVSTSTPDGAPVGLTVSSFNAVSLQPPLVLWSLSVTSASKEVLLHCKRYVINVLAADQLSLAERFACGDIHERYANLPDQRAPGGTRMLPDTCAAWFECFNRSQYHEGDHIIMVGQVEHCGYRSVLPLVYLAGGFDLTPT
jgi:flavin reductase (DIM6/NTAB) family NADH-FMN oxidoreductase RutF